MLIIIEVSAKCQVDVTPAHYSNHLQLKYGKNPIDPELVFIELLVLNNS